MISKRWKLKEVNDDDVSSVQTLTGYCKPISRALALRNIISPEDLDTYLYPLFTKSIDPFVIPSMKDVVIKIWECIQNEKVIVVYGDKDSDGITSTALLSRVLIDLGGKVATGIPSREDGYGLSTKMIDNYIALYSPSLFISVDCGINAEDVVKYINSKNIDVIITDHHEPDENVVTSCLVINPKVDHLPKLEILSGVGIALKLTQALIEFGKQEGYKLAFETNISDYLDIAALGTTADVVPLLGENRLIVSSGLTKMLKTRWVGLKTLLKICGVDKDIDTYHLGFLLAPRINAAGRMGSPVLALELLTTNNAERALELARELDSVNNDRKVVEKAISKEAISIVTSYFDPTTTYGIVVDKEGWNAGVLGIVASKLVGKFNRPSIVLCCDNETGIAKGSCRSIPNVSVLNLLQKCSDLLIRFGGHQMAAGLELKVSDVPEFKRRINLEATKIAKDIDMTPIVEIDDVLTTKDISWDFYDKLIKLKPFGNSNPEPLWRLNNVKVIKTTSIGTEHLKLTLAINNNCVDTVDAMIFNFTLDDLPRPVCNLDIVFALKQNSWHGNMSLQLQVVDLRRTES